MQFALTTLSWNCEKLSGLPVFTANWSRAQTVNKINFLAKLYLWSSSLRVILASIGEILLSSIIDNLELNL